MLAYNRAGCGPRADDELLQDHYIPNMVEALSLDLDLLYSYIAHNR